MVWGIFRLKWFRRFLLNFASLCVLGFYPVCGWRFFFQASYCPVAKRVNYIAVKILKTGKKRPACCLKRKTTIKRYSFSNSFWASTRAPANRKMCCIIMLGVSITWKTTLPQHSILMILPINFPTAKRQNKVSTCMGFVSTKILTPGTSTKPPPKRPLKIYSSI